MSFPVHHKSRYAGGLVVRLASFSVVLVSLFALVGWQLNIEVFKSLHAGLVAMNPVTALAFILAGVSLWLQSSGEASPKAARLGKLLGSAVVLVGLLKLSGIIFGWDLGIDQIFFRNKLELTGTGVPNRISPNAAVSFCLVGCALLLLDVKLRRQRPAQYLALMSSIIPLLAMIGYAYGVRSFYGLASYIPLSLNAATAFLVLCVGILFARPGVGLAPLFSSDTAGGIVVRRLLPIAIALPILLGWLRVMGQRAGLYATTFGTALEAVAYIVIFAGIVYWNARLLHQTDIGRTEAEGALRRRTLELEVANKELEAFCYSVSHDLRAPLRSIDGFSQALIEDYADKFDETAKDYLRRVRMATQRMSMLIDDMLNLSRLTRSEMRMEELDLSIIAKSVAEELKKEDVSRRVEFVIPDGLKARGDTRLMRIAMENLIGNAWKYTSKHERARIEFGRNGRNGKSAYFLRDDGAGFDSQYKDRLFGAFQRLHTANEFAGTGVGLATVQRIIHRHGGTVWAEGEVEQGATFYFTLGVDRSDQD